MIKLAMGLKCGQVLFSNARHKALYGGRGAEKIWAIAAYLILRACQSRKRIVCARQFQNSIRDCSKELLEKRIRDLELSDQFTVTNQTIMHYETLSDFLFVGLERNIESIRSSKAPISSGSRKPNTISARTMEILLPTIRAPHSELIWCWNPNCRPIRSMPSFAVGIRRPIPASPGQLHRQPILRQYRVAGEMELMRANNPARYRHVWLGEYDISYESKVFTNVMIGRPELPPNTRPLYGMDFGFGSDPSAVVKVYAIEKTAPDLRCCRGGRARSHGPAARTDRFHRPQSRRPDPGRWVATWHHRVFEITWLWRYRSAQGPGIGS